MNNQRIVLFFVFTFLWTWLFWAPMYLPSIGYDKLYESIKDFKMIFMVIGASGPLFISIFFILQSKGIKGLKEHFKKLFDFKVKIQYYLIAIILVLLPMAIAHYSPYILNTDRLPNSYFPVEAGLPLSVTLFIYIFVMFLIGGGQEEFGWRGFILEPLQDKIGVIKASVLIGLIWGIWHIPLWFMPSESHAYYSFIGFVLFAISLSVMIGIMYNISGKKFMIAWVMHAMSNFFLSMFPVFFMEDKPQIAYWLLVILNILVTICLGIWYKKRKQFV